MRYEIRTEVGRLVDRARDIDQARRKTQLAARRNPWLAVMAYDVTHGTPGAEVARAIYQDGNHGHGMLAL